METQEKKIEALVNWLRKNDYPETTKEDVTELHDQFEVHGMEFLVLKETEANERAREEITDSLWAFNSSFILSQCELNSSDAIINSLTEMRRELCESGNDFLLALIKGTCGLSTFVKSAIQADGRGHFLAFYDFKENEESDFFIYRTNSEESMNTETQLIDWLLTHESLAYFCDVSPGIAEMFPWYRGAGFYDEERNAVFLVN